MSSMTRACDAGGVLHSIGAEVSVEISLYEDSAITSTTSSTMIISVAHKDDDTTSMSDRSSTCLITSARNLAPTKHSEIMV